MSLRLADGLAQISPVVLEAVGPVKITFFIVREKCNLDRPDGRVLLESQTDLASSCRSISLAQDLRAPMSATVSGNVFSILAYKSQSTSFKMRCTVRTDTGRLSSTLSWLEDRFPCAEVRKSSRTWRFERSGTGIRHFICREEVGDAT